MDPSVRPELVAEVKFHGWTNDRITRAPIFLRIREDKSPDECTIETEEQLSEVIRRTDDASTYHTPYIKQSNSNGNNRQSSNKQLFSNLDKIFWNETKDHKLLTKEDLIDYYEKISEYILLIEMYGLIEIYQIVLILQTFNSPSKYCSRSACSTSTTWDLL
jgi:bifunctional non-homologous end joining protein LigD